MAWPSGARRCGDCEKYDYLARRWMCYNLGMKKLWISICVATLGILGVGAAVGVGEVYATQGNCYTSILPDTWCNNSSNSSTDDNGIWRMLGFILTILNYGVGVLAAVGLTIAGVQYTTAADNSDRVAQAKKRIFDIVLALIIYAVLAIIGDFLLPGGLIT